MTSSHSAVAYIADQLEMAGEIRNRKMFGEYGEYCDEVLIGIICDDTLFIKPTKQGLEFCGDIELASPITEQSPVSKYQSIIWKTLTGYVILFK